MVAETRSREMCRIFARLLQRIYRVFEIPSRECCGSHVDLRLRLLVLFLALKRYNVNICVIVCTKQTRLDLAFPEGAKPVTQMLRRHTQGLRKGYAN